MIRSFDNNGLGHLVYLEMKKIYTQLLVLTIVVFGGVYLHLYMDWFQDGFVSTVLHLLSYFLVMKIDAKKRCISVEPWTVADPELFVGAALGAIIMFILVSIWAIYFSRGLWLPPQRVYVLGIICTIMVIFEERTNQNIMVLPNMLVLCLLSISILNFTKIFVRGGRYGVLYWKYPMAILFALEWALFRIFLVVYVFNWKAANKMKLNI